MAFNSRGTWVVLNNTNKKDFFRLARKYPEHDLFLYVYLMTIYHLLNAWGGNPKRNRATMAIFRNVEKNMPSSFHLLAEV